MNIIKMRERGASERYSTISRRAGAMSTQQNKGKLLDYGLGGHLSSPSTHVLLSPSHRYNQPTIISTRSTSATRNICHLFPTEVSNGTSESEQYKTNS